LICSEFLSAQITVADSNRIVPVNASFVKYIYNPQTKSTNFSYDYSNLWDIDGDNKNDSLYFIGNGAAHTYFYLRIILSSDNEIRNFPFIQLDMPYFSDEKSLLQFGKNPGLQFVVNDFDKDGVKDVYCNFNNTMSTIPKSWRIKGIKTKYVVMNLKKGKMQIRDY
jgi:hypothetical protein